MNKKLKFSQHTQDKQINLDKMKKRAILTYSLSGFINYDNIKDIIHSSEKRWSTETQSWEHLAMSKVMTKYGDNSVFIFMPNKLLHVQLPIHQGY